MSKKIIVNEEKLIQSVAKKLGKEGLEYYKKHHELPLVQLTPEEMKFVNGGGFIEWLKKCFDAFNNGTVDITGVGNKSHEKK